MCFEPLVVGVHNAWTKQGAIYDLLYGQLDILPVMINSPACRCHRSVIEQYEKEGAFPAA